MNFWLIKYRLPIVILFTLVTLLSLLLIPRLEVNPDLEKYVPDRIGNQKYLKELDSIFGGNEMVMVMLHSEDVVNYRHAYQARDFLRRPLVKLDGIDRCISPFDAKSISTKDGFIVMQPLLDTLPETEEACEVLKVKNQGQPHVFALLFFA